MTQVRDYALRSFLAGMFLVLLGACPIVPSTSEGVTVDVRNKYSGVGDAVFFLNETEGRAVHVHYSLHLGSAEADLYLISTNTSTNERDVPAIDTDLTVEVADHLRLVENALPPSVHNMPQVTAFNARAPIGAIDEQRSGATAGPIPRRPSQINGDRYHIPDLYRNIDRDSRHRPGSSQRRRQDSDRLGGSMPTVVDYYESDRIAKFSFPSRNFEHSDSKTGTDKSVWTSFDVELISTLAKQKNTVFIGHYDQLARNFGRLFKHAFPLYTSVDMSHFVDESHRGMWERIVDFLLPDGTKPFYHIAEVSHVRIEDIASIDDFGVFWHIYFVECSNIDYMAGIVKRLGESNEDVCQEPAVNGLFYKDTLQGRSFFVSRKYRKRDFLSQECFKELSKKILWSERSIPDIFDSSYIRDFAGGTMESDGTIINR